LINKRLLRNFTFHGQVDESEFGKVLNKTHLIISPNSPFKLNNGAFDGFPLGSCVTAGYFKNALFMTDYFDESASIQWRDDFHFCKINFASKDITNEILPYLKNRKKLK